MYHEDGEDYDPDDWDFGDETSHVKKAVQNHPKPSAPPTQIRVAPWANDPNFARKGTAPSSGQVRSCLPAGFEAHAVGSGSKSNAGQSRARPGKDWDQDVDWEKFKSKPNKGQNERARGRGTGGRKCNTGAFSLGGTPVSQTSRGTKHKIPQASSNTKDTPRLDTEYMDRPFTSASNHHPSTKSTSAPTQNDQYHITQCAGNANAFDVRERSSNFSDKNVTNLSSIASSLLQSPATHQYSSNTEDWDSNEPGDRSKSVASTKSIQPVTVNPAQSLLSRAGIGRGINKLNLSSKQNTPVAPGKSAQSLQASSVITPVTIFNPDNFVDPDMHDPGEPIVNANFQTVHEQDSMWNANLSWDAPVSKAEIETNQNGQPFYGAQTDSLGEPLDPEIADIIHSNPGVSPAWIASILGRQSNAPKVTDLGNGTVPTGPLHIDKEWLRRLEQIWSEKNRNTQSQTNTMLRECFSTVVNPYVTVLYLVEKAKDFHTGKTTTLAFAVMKEFERCARGDTTKYKTCVDQSLRVHAFNIGTKANFFLFDLIVKAFQLDEGDTEYFLPIIRPYIEKRKYKEAVMCVTKLGLQDHFSMRDICLPLILQDKINLVESYVYRRKDQQIALLQLLDTLVRDNAEIGLLIHEYEVTIARREKLTAKILTKLAVRLMKLYQVPQEYCPNICTNKTLAGLRYLMFKKYTEESIGGEQWVELVQSHVNDNEWLQEQLVQLLVSWCDLAEAARWAKHYNVKQDALPYQIVGMVEAAKDFQEPEEPENWDVEAEGGPPSTSRYHKLNLPQEAIVWVDNKDTFYDCLHMVSLPGGRVGIDAEWQPSFGQVLMTRIALLQLATDDTIFLLDMLALTQILTDQDWCQLAAALFCNNDVLKLGYGIEGDLQMLVKSVPRLKEPLNNMHRVVELNFLQKSMCQVFPGAFDSPPDVAVEAVDDDDSGRVTKSEERGLSDLVRQCLGQPLDKSQQMSDWEKRPLRQQQISYAALDALCLIQVYDVMMAKAKDNHLDINMEPSVTRITKSKKSRRELQQSKVAERPKTQMAPNPPKREGPAIVPGELRVVCDTMLQGLGRHLRCCGVDVAILNTSDDHETAATIARQQKRVVLTSGTPFNMLRNQVAGGMCYNVSQGTVQDQVKEILDQFNVTVTSGDIFSRCQVCNGNNYLTVEPHEMKQAWLAKMDKLSGNVPTSTLKSAKSSSNSMDANQGYTTVKTALPRQNDATYSLDDFLNNEKDDEEEIVFEYDHINLENLTVGEKNVPLQIEVIPEGMFDQVDVFYVCADCGKAFWEGSHFTKVRQQFSHVLEDASKEDTIYNALKKKIAVDSNKY